jgi:hypothetical protein
VILALTLFLLYVASAWVMLRTATSAANVSAQAMGLKRLLVAVRSMTQALAT